MTSTRGTDRRTSPCLHLVLCLALCLASPSRPQGGDDTSSSSRDTIDLRRGFAPGLHQDKLGSGESIGLPYRWAVPQPDEDAPTPILALVLHAEPLRGDDNLLTIRGMPLRLEATSREHPVVVVVPQCPAGRTWLGSGPQDSLVPVVDRLLDRVQSDLVERGRSTDSSRWLIVGLGMGADAAIELGASTIGRFAGVLAASPGRREADRTNPVVRPSRAAPTWVWHGTYDPLVPVSAARELARIHRDAGHPLLYSERDLDGHAVWPEAFVDELALGWLMRRRTGELLQGALLVEAEGDGVGWRDPLATDDDPDLFSFSPQKSEALRERFEEWFRTPVAVDDSTSGAEAVIAYREGGVVRVSLGDESVVGYARSEGRIDGVVVLSSGRFVVSDSESGRIAMLRMRSSPTVAEEASIGFPGASALVPAPDGRSFWCAGDEGVARFEASSDAIRRLDLMPWPDAGRRAGPELPTMVCCGTRIVVCRSGQLSVLETSGSEDGLVTLSLSSEERSTEHEVRRVLGSTGLEHVVVETTEGLLRLHLGSGAVEGIEGAFAPPGETEGAVGQERRDARSLLRIWP